MNFTSAMLALAIACAAEGEPPAPAEIHLEAVLVTLIEQVEVPAQEAGVLSRVDIREGDAVHEGDLLAKIQDIDAELISRRARLELDVARHAANTDVEIRLAKKQLELAKNELGRAKESIERFKKSVSAAALDKLQLEAEKSVLAIEHAQQQYDLAQLSPRIKENEVAVAERGIARRQIVSPIDGIVVQIKRRRGEWVEPGEAVIRVVRMDRLRVEGFVSAAVAAGPLLKQAVTLHVQAGEGESQDFRGEIVFVSPEIDPVNGQVRIWAEVENRGQLLRPGQVGSLDIHGEDTQPVADPPGEEESVGQPQPPEQP
ncbi:MAG: efflux RND transporter periplasmic adaptor subunit [Pirellulales bacterium]